MCWLQVSAAVRKMQEEVAARQAAEAEAARLAEEQRIAVGAMGCIKSFCNACLWPAADTWALLATLQA